jgi:hypothetical protein
VFKNTSLKAGPQKQCFLGPDPAQGKSISWSYNQGTSVGKLVQLSEKIKFQN